MEAISGHWQAEGVNIWSIAKPRPVADENPVIGIVSCSRGRSLIRARGQRERSTVDRELCTSTPVWLWQTVQDEQQLSRHQTAVTQAPFSTGICIASFISIVCSRTFGGILTYLLTSLQRGQHRAQKAPVRVLHHPWAGIALSDSCSTATVRYGPVITGSVD